MQRQFIDIEDFETLVLREDTAPTPAAGQISIAVDHAGVNRADVLQRMGLYPVPPDASPIMGLEVAGTVLEVGPDTSDFAAGDRVCALVQGGGYANVAIAQADHTLRIPETVSVRDAAGLPEALLTVWHNVFRLGKLQAGETALIHGGASGIGSLAVQMAKARGATVIATAGGAEKCARVAALGASFVADYRAGDIKQQFTDAGYAGAIDVVLDMAGGDFTQINLDLAAADGRIVCIGVMRGSKADIDLFPFLMKRLTLTGSTLRGMGTEGRAEGFRQIQAEIMGLVQSGDIVPVIDSVFPLANAMDAHKYMESGQHIGKILLDCNAS